MNETKNPEISIIVPVYKVEKYLNGCINSILAQTFPDFEVILVDDGSPDSCPALCDAAAARDRRVRVIHKPNGGVSTARNAGLDAARGSWIGFVDPDDDIEPCYYEKLYQAAKQSGAELAVSDILYFDADGSLSGYQEKALRTEVLPREEAIHRMRLTPLIHVTTRLHRRELFDSIRFPVGRNYEDALTTPLVLEQVTAVACVGEPLYHYRFNPVGIVRTQPGLKNLDEVYANDALLECALKYGKKDTACLQYVIMQSTLRKLKKSFPLELKNDARVQQTEQCVQQAREKIRQSGAMTARNLLEAWLRQVNAPLYNRFKYQL